MHRFLQILSLTAIYGVSLTGLQAQSTLEAEQLALSHLKAKASGEAYTVQDLRDLEVSHAYTDESTGITYVYLQQHIGDVEIKDAVASIGILKDKVYSFTHRLVDHLDERLTSVVPTLNDREAIAVAVAQFGEQYDQLAARSTATTDEQGNRIYPTPSFGNRPVRVADAYIVNDNGELRRSLRVYAHQRDGANNWLVDVDAVTGEVLSVHNQTLHCNFGAHAFLQASHAGGCEHDAPTMASSHATVLDKENGIGTYRVFPWPIESPNHGEHELIFNPADSVASPYGWHDTNGEIGAEYTITRGNNVHAYLDHNDDAQSDGNEPDGGEELVFDFPYSSTESPYNLVDADVTNLFYAVNRMHDFTYQYGFDEKAGNFQRNNYGRGGKETDAIEAQSQDGATLGTDGERPDADHLNNANFSTQGDGTPGVIQMYLWGQSVVAQRVVQAIIPSDAVGTDYGISGAAVSGWGKGAPVDEDTYVEGQVITVDDGIANQSTTDGCTEILNADDVNGKIALIDRGACEFGTKAKNAQDAGAIAVIICNFEDNVINLAGGKDGDDVTIPTLMLTSAGCEKLRLQNEQFSDLTIKIELPEEELEGPEFVSSSFDNGIVAHEFGHGVSLRLTGGPDAICLSGLEQMGEGWSDFFTLVTSVSPGDDGNTPRGIGTFTQREETTGGGIRNFPYSYDMVINPVTYEDVANTDFSAPHGVGSIWASMLWDLYWNMVAAHGYDNDLMYGQGGNNKAIQLVMTGMKLQPCNPGFVDGRDAILKADKLLSASEDSDYGDSNEKLIWETFARRGLGAFADQGSSEDRFDGTADFNIPYELQDNIFLTKAITPSAKPGGEATVTLAYKHYPQTEGVTSATITDIIPEGATNVQAVGNYKLDAVGDVVSIELTDLKRGDEMELQYTYTLPEQDPQLYRAFYIENSSIEADWLNENEQEEENEEPIFWEIDESVGYQDEVSWHVEGSLEENSPYVGLSKEQAVSVRGDNPVMSFYHMYEASPQYEGLIMEVYDADLDSWRPMREDQVLRGDYDNLVDYQAFIIPKITGFAGEQKEWTQVIVDLSDYIGKDIQLRWHYGIGDYNFTEGSTASEGWWIDHIEFMDAITYNTVATAAAGEYTTSAKAPNVGIFVEPQGDPSSVREKLDEQLGLKAFPNPVNSELVLHMEAAASAGRIELFSATGQRVRTADVAAGTQQLILDVSSLPVGVYTVKLAVGNSVQAARIVRQ